jgi:hypothetical protein
VQRSSGGASWKQFRTIAATGAFHFSVRPQVTTRYRLATAMDAAASVRIRVKAAPVK